MVVFKVVVVVVVFDYGTNDDKMLINDGEMSV